MSIVEEWMNLNPEVAPSIITKMKTNFSSREFIWKFAHEYEDKYIALLNECKELKKLKNKKNGIFHEIHMEIGAYLSDKAEDLGIKMQVEREDSLTVFGTLSSTQCWTR